MRFMQWNFLITAPQLVSGGEDKTIRFWSLNQGRGGWDSTAMQTRHEERILCLAFSPDNQRIFSGGWDKKKSSSMTPTRKRLNNLYF